jgi:hypothetical protein
MTQAFDQFQSALPDRYRIERELGAGGMAIVYLARDVRHDRMVAVKILQPELAAVIGADRFLHEIKVTAGLQHPHILPLFDSGQAGTLLYYVMPFVDGESLRDKLNREKQLPIPEAIRLATEIADALEYAHDRDVIHRDIKPENVLLHRGHALVADFGIALAVTAAGGERITQTGLSVGTPHYMSPEQAMGERNLDRRTDIYALGCLTYEMLVGAPPHSGPTSQAVVARILTDEPRPLRELRSTIPPHVEGAVLTALRKLPADRWSTAAMFAGALQGTVEIPAAVRPPRPAVWRRIARASVPAALVAVALAASLTWGVLGWRRPSETQSSVTRWLNVILPDSAPMAFQGAAAQEGTSLALSRDGRLLAYVSEERTGNRLMLRSLGEPGFKPLEGTAGAHYPFFSPDGRWIGFFADGQLRKVAVDGSKTVALADVRDPGGGAWATDDEILVSEGGGLIQVSAASGNRGTTAARCEVVNRPCWQPDPLPGNEWVLVSSYGDIAVVSRRTGERRVLLDSLFEPQARLLPGDYIAYMHRPGQLFVISFDRSRLKVKGEPVPVVDGVRQGSLGSQFAVSNDGTLVYAGGGHLIRGRFTWVTRQGKETPLPFESQSYGVFNLSPDGRYLASAVYRTNPQIWLYDLVRGTEEPLVTEGSAEHPVWSPDGRSVAFVQGKRTGSVTPIMVVPLARSAPPRPLVKDGGYPFSWSRDNMLSFVRTNQGPTQNDIWVSDLTLGKERVVRASEGTDDAPVFSPDGKWIAYMSTVATRSEIYIEPFPGNGDQWKVSSDGGSFPRWAPNGRELYFMRHQALYAVNLSRGPANASPPTRLLDGPYVETFGHAFAVAPDGNRFLMLKPADARTSASTLTLVEGWLTEVEARIAAARPRTP